MGRGGWPRQLEGLRAFSPEFGERAIPKPAIAGRLSVAGKPAGALAMHAVCQRSPACHPSSPDGVSTEP